MHFAIRFFLKHFFYLIILTSVSVAASSYESGGGQAAGKQRDHFTLFDTCQYQAEVYAGVHKRLLIPTSLSERQLIVARALADNTTHKEIATTFEIPLRAVHDAIGGIEKKLQLFLGMPQLRRTDLSYSVKECKKREVIIQTHSASRSQSTVLVGVGPLTWLSTEWEVLEYWWQGYSTREIGQLLEISAHQVFRAITRLMEERKMTWSPRDWKHYSFSSPLLLSQSQFDFATLRAMGLDRREIHQLTKRPVKTIASQRDKLIKSLKNYLTVHTDRFNLTRLNYFWGTRPNELVLVIFSNKGEMFKVPVKLKERSDWRQSKAQKIVVSYNELQRIVSTLSPNLRVVTQMRIQGFSTQHIAETLSIRVDTVRKRLASASEQIGRQIGSAELNFFNLEVTTN